MLDLSNFYAIFRINYLITLKKENYFKLSLVYFFDILLIVLSRKDLLVILYLSMHN